MNYTDFQLGWSCLPFTDYDQILVLHRLKNRTMQHSMRFSPDTASLLGGSDIPTEETAIMKKQRKQIINPSAEPKVSLPHS